MIALNKIKVGVVIPWREQPSRVKAFNAVVSWYNKNMPESKLYFPNHPGDVWLPSATRNDGVRMAEKDGCDVIVMNDADTIPNLNALKEAILEAAEDEFIHIGYTKFSYLTKQGSDDFFSGRAAALCEQHVHPYVNFGVNIFKPSSWWSIGGQDEKFKQWGSEDTAMGIAHKILKGREFISHRGFAFALNHEKQPQAGNKNFENNNVLFDKYCKIDNVKDMIQLIMIKNIF
jgi:hypothetical protein